jgi:prefoldin subunit 5
MREKIPRDGKRVITAKGVGIVVGGKPIEEKVLVELESGVKVELSIDEVTDENKEKSGERGRVK